MMMILISYFQVMLCVVRGCLKDNDFVMLLNSGGIDPEDEEED